MPAPKAVQMRIACGSPAAARTGVQRRPCGGVAAFAGGAKAARIAVRIPSGSMATICAPSTADTATAVAAIWPKRRARRGPAAKKGPSPPSPPIRSQQAQRQAGPDRAPANGDGREGRRRRRPAPTTARPMRRPRPKSTKRGRPAENEHRRARRGSTQGPSARTKCG